jgi:hypothetical protein
MRITLVYTQVRCERPEGPEENVSRYTVRPGTLGLTLDLVEFVITLAPHPNDINSNLTPSPSAPGHP